MSSTLKPVISIIVPVYKAEKYLHRCVDSILKQTFKDFELILVDDGSPDKSGEICDEYSKKDNRVRVLHKNNEGVSIARNKGIELSKADLLCFVDSDDWVEDTYLFVFIDNFKSGTMVFQGILYDYEEDSSKNMPFFEYDDIDFDITDENLIERYNILENGCPYGKLYEKEIIYDYKIRFNKDISTHEDHLFVWQYMQHIKRLKLSNVISYHYMKNGVESLSSMYHPSEEYIKVADLLFEELEKIKEIYRISNIKQYLSRIISLYIINQYIIAIYNCNSSNFRNIIKGIKTKRKLINKYYQFQCKSYNIIYYLIKMKVYYIFIFIIVKIVKHLSCIKNRL